MTWLALPIVLLLGLLGVQDAPTTATQSAARFTSVDLFVDPNGQTLAAYQLEFLGDPARVTLVGIEGGEHPAFREPPYYDPAALAGSRVILAALHTGNELPSARTRVATLHLRVVGEDEPTYEAKIQVAGNPEGKPIEADVTVGQGVKR